MEKSERWKEGDKVLQNLNILNDMISLSAERLDGLRTQCATTAEITQQEIRTLEGKLIKLFSNQLMAKNRIPAESLPYEYQLIPSLKLWLQVVGLTADLIKEICSRVRCLESLKERSEQDVRSLMTDCHANEEETRRLTKALYNLRRYTEVIRCQDVAEGSFGTGENMDLYWDSWDMQKVTAAGGVTTDSNLKKPRSRASRSSVPSEEYLNQNQSMAGQTCSTTPCTPVTTFSPSCLNSPLFSTGSHGNHSFMEYSPTNSSVFSPSSPMDPTLTPPSTPPIKSKDKKFPTTPPARKKHHAVTGPPAGSLQPDNFPLTKSKSHESQLANRIECTSEISLVSLEQLPVSGGAKRRERLPTEPGPQSNSSVIQSGGNSWDSCASSIGHSSPVICSPIKSPPLVHSDADDLDPSGQKAATLQVPKSPRTPTLARSMGHMISHRFVKMFKMSTCDYCFKQVIIGLKCKECKFKCHRDCEPRVPPSCGLPAGFIDIFAQSLQKQADSPNPSRFPNSSPGSQSWMKNRKLPRPSGNIHSQPFSGPDSSSNSSCNSSTPSSPALFATTSSFPNHLFSFPDVGDRELTMETRTVGTISSGELTSTEKSNDSDRTVSQTSGSGSTDSEKTIAIRVDSLDSQISDGEPNDRASWPRQNSLSNREWDIPFDELKMGEKIGTGHFGTVYRGNWHGDVAIKVLDMTYLDNEKTLEQFKQEVSIFRKTRHENVVLFMGACMKPPRLAIVTSMCKGNSLYTHLHLRKDKFNMNKTVLVAQQISQGMGYLHARGIIHKDLKSRNIFLESGKVVITDFGLFSVTKLCQSNRQGDCLSIPPGWLPYLAPEIMKNLRVTQKNDNELPFSKASDTYAFGTVWYELLCGEWPYKGLPPEAIIWQVGSGIRQPLPTLFSRDVKEILLMCWSSKPEDRLDFTRLLKTLEKLPKKRLARSPSHPIHLSRSAESVF
ncbi:unnamed protein product [Allacma fusca]|uniref:Kinase suppressor of Ras 2 n=1 Tax=Allacma fusca TaxID=39272 RepID=A0A8J2JWA1_9HEXA|nr:unnamed protein product [Allacma fusca]